MTEDFLLYQRLAKLEETVHNLHTSLDKALKEIQELKQRAGDDDCK